MKKKYIVSFFLMLLPVVLANAKAIHVCIDSIGYNLIRESGTAEVTSSGYKYKGDIIIPESVTYQGVEYSVTSIGDAFFYCDKMTSVSIPNTVTNICGSAFSYCSGLSEIIIPNSVTSIGDNAFMDCTGLTSLTIPESVTSIGGYVFANCTGLTSVTIPSSLTIISDHAFYGCI